MPSREFAWATRDLVLDLRSRQLSRLSQVEEDTSLPPFWRAAAARFGRECRATLKEKAFFCPIEFRDDRGSIAEALKATQTFVMTFGDLLEAWPSVWDSARRLGPVELLNT
jgi:hypothetical protein